MAPALYIRHRSSLHHDTGPHPENARRILAIEEALSERNWLGLELVDAPVATEEQLLRVHPRSHIERIEAICRRGGGALDPDTVVSEGSWEAALRAAGGAVHAVDRLLGANGGGRGGRDGPGFAFCGLRPPGHHAETAKAMGFCLFNNAAIAAAHALAEHDAERVFILDWDVHHGNGTEAIFAQSPQVLYTSIHQSPLYPGTGAANYTGEGEGKGYTLNLPVPPFTGPDEFIRLVEEVAIPRLLDHNPSLVIVSAGFDAHRDDPLAQCQLDEAAYATMATSIRDAATSIGAPILACLEGGYDLNALATSVTATIEAFITPALA